MFLRRPTKSRVTRAGAAVGVALGALAAGDAFGATNYVYARVVDVEPIVRHVTVERPRHECWEEVVYERTPAGRPFSVAGQTLAGGIVGAAIGRQFGGGSGRDAATIAGALAGSAVAHERALRVQPRAGGVHAVPVERCHVVSERHTEQRVDGYWVTYAYDGRRYRTRTRQHPGDRVRLQVTVQPVGL